MSDLPFLCRKCGERLSAPRGTEGRKATCHVCGEEMLVPHGGTAGSPVPRGDAITAAPAPPPAPAPPSLPTTIQASPLPPPLPVPPMAGYGHAKAAPPHTATRNDPGHVSRRLIAVGAALFVLVGFCVLSGAGLVAIYLLNRGAPADAHAKGAPAPQDKAPAKDKDSAPTTSKPTVAKGKQDTGDKPPDAESPPPKKDGPLSLRFIPEKEITERVLRAGGKIGKVTVSLAWQNYNDLDLHVVTSSGEKIYWANRRSTCGGQLDIDQNVSPTTTTPVENVYWPTDSPPRGPIKIYVHHFMNHRRPGCEDPTRFVVRVQLDDQVQTFEGAVSHQGNPLAFVAEIPIPPTQPKGKAP